ncbi:hypothetical protein [Planococcus sp. S3-L1]|uniref:hypothetical protein n=1 Tax=Planococcus sp. S3-L1 TaxID=3046200 RepID=UPI0024B89CCE|nr:hypothetical protein [Planococcus sp. S3-L1]MDJ0333279.1 hypothetical protein [Planococcus sp. S3-L1]
MKKLSGELSTTQTPKKKSTTLMQEIDTEKTTSRKIFLSDYKLLDLYAWSTEQSVTSALNEIHNRLKAVIKEKGVSVLNPITKEDIEDDSPKNIRISSDFNQYLKDLSKETKIPAKYLLTVCLEYFKEELIGEIKKSQDKKYDIL